MSSRVVQDGAARGHDPRQSSAVPHDPAPAHEPLITLVVPLVDSRGDAAEHVRSWTIDQSLDHERYEVIVAAPGRDEEHQRGLAEILTPHDRLLLRERDDVSLYDAAAEEARGRWLVLTESHCVADRDCLKEIAAAIDEDPDQEALTLEHGHIVHTAVDRMSARWFEDVYRVWNEPGQWRRLNVVGVAIRRDAYLAEGGLEHRFGLFSAFLLGARMDARGARIRHVRAARVGHVHTYGIRDHHEHVIDHVTGSCDARAALAAPFCEQYFGHARIWATAGRYRPEVARSAALALTRTIVGARRGRTGLARDLAGWLPAAGFGVRPHLAWRRLRFLACEVGASRLPLPGDGNFKLYLRALKEIAAVTELEWIHRGDPRGAPVPLGRGHRSVEDLDRSLIATHGLESHEGKRFRWTEPVSVILCRPEALVSAELRIDTGGLRGSPLEYVQDVYLGSRRVPREHLRVDVDGRLCVRLPRSGGRARRWTPIVMIAAPLVPAEQGSQDERRLGVPVFSLELVAV